MSTIFREWSYQYAWVYTTVSWLAALSVGGIDRFHRLFLRDNPITKDMSALDLCCGSGPITQILLEFTDRVTGLDASPKAIDRAKQNAPKADYVVSLAEQMPFPDRCFDFVVCHTAFHEMTQDQLKSIVSEVKRILKPEGRLVIIDFHSPTNPLFWPAVSLFLYLFETETAWELITTDLPEVLTSQGFTIKNQHLYAGGSLQIVTAVV